MQTRQAKFAGLAEEGGGAAFASLDLGVGGVFCLLLLFRLQLQGGVLFSFQPGKPEPF